MKKKMKPRIVLLLAVTIALTLAGRSGADEITDWTQTLFRSNLMTNPTTSPLVTTRVAAIFSSAVFDAVNGIDGRYAPIHVTPAAPDGASRRAAAVQAAYASMLLLFPTAQYPSLKGALDGRRATSLALIGNDPHESPASIADGIAWGQTVADAIFAWRSTDGFTPPPPAFLGGNAVGQWRPTPPGLLSGAGPQFAYMTPWVMTSPAQFHPLNGPPALTSDRYAADFNETRTMGSMTSALRTVDQTVAAMFWNSTTASYLWNQVALSLLDQQGRGSRRHDTLLHNARLFVLLNLAMADAAIACWEAKYSFVFWRPVTAIPLGDTDGNAATVADATFVPLLVTPNHPEYPSGHSTVSSAAAAVLATAFGKRARFSLESDLMLGVTRSFRGFSDALDDVKDARIFAGIHFRSACDDGQAIGGAVGLYVLGHAALPVD